MAESTPVQPRAFDESAARADAWLRRSAVAWYLVAATGQLAFVHFILAFFGTRTLAGQSDRWNEKPLIDGYIAGDDFGNLMFAGHALGAAVITLGGLIQLIPPCGTGSLHSTAGAGDSSSLWPGRWRSVDSGWCGGGALIFRWCPRSRSRSTRSSSFSARRWPGVRRSSVAWSTTGAGRSGDLWSSTASGFFESASWPG